MYRIAVIMFFIGFCGFSQESAVQYKAGIKNNFSMPAIAAYQESSMAKVADFYQYLEIISDPSQPASLKEQVRQNVKSLLFDGNLIIRDFTSSDLATTFDDLLEKIDGKGFKFKIVRIDGFSAVSLDFWTNSYTLEITNGKQTVVKTIRQRIYFGREYKKFGDSEKEVWQLQLGEIE